MESLNNLSDVPNDDATRKTLSTLSLRQLESRVTQTLDDLQNAQNDLATYNSQLVSCKRSRNACKMRCSTPPSSCSRSAIV